MGKRIKVRKQREHLTKDQYKQKIVEYLANPDNPPITRTRLAIEVLGFADESPLYYKFKPAELSAIEREALALRRSCYANELAKVDKSLLKRAASKKGTAADAKLAYQRFEGWSEKKVHEFVLDTPEIQTILDALPAEVAIKLRYSLLKKIRGTENSHRGKKLSQDES